MEDDDEEEEEEEDESGNIHRRVSLMLPNKKLIGRSYVLSDNGMYERIIRKRKRKSGD